MGADLLAFLTGVLLVAAVGLLHHQGLLRIKRLAPEPRTSPHLCIAVMFGGLLALHVTEILLFALVYRAVLQVPGIGELGGSFAGTWGDYIYYSGMNFATLGYTGITASGAVRLVSMLQSLGGFMLITWSATFIYAVWGDIWRES